MRISDWSSDVCSSDLADHRCSHAGAVRRIDHAADRRFHARDIRTDTGTAAMIAPGLAGVEAQLWLWLIAMIRPGAAFFAAQVFGTRAVTVLLRLVPSMELAMAALTLVRITMPPGCVDRKGVGWGKS